MKLRKLNFIFTLQILIKCCFIITITIFNYVKKCEGFSYNNNYFEFYQLTAGKIYTRDENSNKPWVSSDGITDYKFEIIKPSVTKTHGQHLYLPISSLNWITLNDKYFKKVESGKMISPKLSILVPDNSNNKGKFYWFKLAVYYLQNNKKVLEHEWDFFLDVSYDPKEILPIYEKGKNLIKEAEKYEIQHYYKRALQVYNDYINFYQNNYKIIKSYPYPLLPENIAKFYPLEDFDSIKFKISECNKFVSISEASWDIAKKEGYSKELFEKYLDFIKGTSLNSPHFYNKDHFEYLRGNNFISAIMKTINETNDPVIKYRLIYILGDIGNDLNIELLNQIVKDKNNFGVIRWNAINALNRAYNKESINILIDALNDKIPGVRWSAANVLGEIGDESVINILKKSKTIKDGTFLNLIEKSISKITKKARYYCNYKMGFSIMLPQKWELDFEGYDTHIFRGQEQMGTYPSLKIFSYQISEESKSISRNTMKNNEPFFPISYPIGEDIKIGEIIGRKSFRLSEAGKSFKFKNFKEIGIQLFKNTTDYYFIELTSPEPSFNSNLENFNLIINSFRILSDNINVLNIIDLNKKTKWKEWLYIKFPDMSNSIPDEAKIKLNEKIINIKNDKIIEIFSDFNNDNKVDALIISINGKEFIERDFISDLKIYTFENSDWKEMISYNKDGEDENFTMEFFIDKNGNLAINSMVNGCSDIATLHWKPFNKTYCHDGCLSICDDY